MRSNRTIRTAAFAALLGASALGAWMCGSSTPAQPSTASNTAAPPPPQPQCDGSLWNHVHDPNRLKVVTQCQTVTGVIATAHGNDDGDIDMQLVVDPPYTYLLNAANYSKLNGHLQTEAICQSPVHNDVPDALRACRNFTGTVPIPALGTHVQITGTYALDQDHGWMEIHPISVLTVGP